VARALRCSPGLDEVMVHTGQHFDDNMSGVFFRELDIPEPKYNLGVSGVSHGAMTGRMLEGVEQIMIDESPDVVVVYGDTNSTLAGALAARKLHIPVAHVEAGLRSFDMKMPEEVNRILADRISDILFCPTDTAMRNLSVEGFDNYPVWTLNVGDVMYDAVLYFREATSPAEVLDLPNEFVLCTIHRAENTDNPIRLRSIFWALDEIAESVPIVLPIHPRTLPLLESHGIKTKVRLIEPVGYTQMLELIARSSIVMTDSGGLQKEAFFLEKFCITLRNTTEWSELVEGGFNILAGADRERIICAFNEAAGMSPDFSARPYGSGNAGELIVKNLEAYLA